MKTRLIIICLLATISSYAQNQIGKGLGSPLHYEAVIKADSATKKDFLYEKAIDWMSRTFKSSKAVIQSQDKDLGFVIGRFSYMSNLNDTDLNTNYANIKISVKDGKIKYELYDFINAYYGAITDGEWEDPHSWGKGIRKKCYATMQADSRTQANILVASLNNYFTGLKADSNW